MRLVFASWVLAHTTGCKVDTAPPSLDGGAVTISDSGSDEEESSTDTDTGADPGLPCDEPPALTFTKLELALGAVAMGGTDSEDCLEPPPAVMLRPCEGETAVQGVAVADYDGDGIRDLVLSNAYGPGRLMRGIGDGTFEDATIPSALALNEPSSGVAWFDPDKDGDLDLIVTTWQGSRNKYFRNEGDGTFVEDAIAVGLDMTSEIQLGGTSIAVGDYDLDGWPDLFVAKWLPTPLESGGVGSRLLHNRGAEAPGTFEDLTIESGLEFAGAGDLEDGTHIFVGFSPAFVDLDQDDFPDLIVVADFENEQLYRNEGDGTFTNVTEAAGVGATRAGMGLAVGDINGDARLDYFASSISAISTSCEHWQGNPDGNRLYLNAGGTELSFSEGDADARVTCGSWGWGVVFADIDNDGDSDIAQTNGFFGEIDVIKAYEQDPDRLWINDGDPSAGMQECSTELGFDENGQGRALAAMDIENDGDLDLIETRAGETPLIYRNDAEHDHGFLRVSLQGETSNTSGRGARIGLRVEAEGPMRVAEVGQSSHYQGHGELVAHFGLGPGIETINQVRVCWPVSKRMQIIDGVLPDDELVLLESDADINVDVCATALLEAP